MTKFEKELLLKDLCARLPYDIKVYDKNGNFNTSYVNLLQINGKLSEAFVGNGMQCRTVPIDDIKPYLFPLSSMTKTQKMEYDDNLTYLDYTEGGWTVVKSNGEYIIPYWFVDFCNKNHFDYRGLIEKGLAIDATNKNIY